MPEIPNDDGPDRENVTIPAALMAEMVVFPGAPALFGTVRRAVERFNQATGRTFDPISVAEILVKDGYIINLIPTRKVEIEPTQEGLILDVKQVLQIIADDRVSEFPILERAIKIVKFLGVSGDGNLGHVLESLGRQPTRWIVAGEDTQADDSGTAVRAVLTRHVTWDFRFGSNTISSPEMAEIVPRIVEQTIFILENVARVDQLITETDRSREKRRQEQAEREARDARESRRAELFASKEAAERWLFGVARGAYKDANEDVEKAARVLAQSRQAQDLIAHHHINLFDFTDRQIADTGNDSVWRRHRGERDRRHHIARIAGPLSILLLAFAKPRRIDSSAQAIRANASGVLYDKLMLWRDAKFVKELPDGAHDDAFRAERDFQQRDRDRTRDRLRRDSDWGLGLDEARSFYRGLEAEEGARSDHALRTYQRLPIAALWWQCPSWLQLKILKPYVRDEIIRISEIVHGFSGKQFLAHIDGLMAEQNRGSAGLPPRGDLAELRDYVNLELVMSSDDRTAEVERRKKERERNRSMRFLW